MTNIHEEIESILKKHGEHQANLTSEAARKIITDEICKNVLGKGKTILLEEIKSLRSRLAEIEDLIVEWPHNDVY